MKTAEHLIACTVDEVEQQEQRLTEAKREERCLRRAIWGMFLLLMCALAGAGHSAVLLKEATPFTLRHVIQVFLALGLASTVCLIVFAGLWACRWAEIGHQRDECRRATLRTIGIRGLPRN